MENINDNNIETQLEQELKRLRKAIDYIEQAKRETENATSLLTEMRKDKNELRDELEELVDAKIQKLREHLFEQSNSSREFWQDKLESIEKRVNSLEERLFGKGLLGRPPWDKEIRRSEEKHDKDLVAIREEYENVIVATKSQIKKQQRSINLLWILTAISLAISIGLTVAFF